MRTRKRAQSKSQRASETFILSLSADKIFQPANSKDPAPFHKPSVMAFLQTAVEDPGKTPLSDASDYPAPWRRDALLVPTKKISFAFPTKRYQSYHMGAKTVLFWMLQPCVQKSTWVQAGAHAGAMQFSWLKRDPRGAQTSSGQTCLFKA